MPSPRFQRLRRTSTEAAGLLWLACLIACSSAPPPAAVPARPEPAEPRLAKSEKPYLVDPSTGYPQVAEGDPARRDELTAGYHRLLDEGDLAAAREAADAVLAADPGFPAALVLAAQADFAADRWTEVVERLVPVLDKLPTYVAGQLVLGRAAEKLGDLPLAYSAYRAIAAKSSLAFFRTGELHPRALEIVLRRLEGQVRGQQLDEAEKNLALLRAWAPAEETTFAAARSLAVARGDHKAR
jgi:tetratricopeptide (TPR) repeat protein